MDNNIVYTKAGDNGITGLLKNSPTLYFYYRIPENQSAALDMGTNGSAVLEVSYDNGVSYSKVTSLPITIDYSTCPEPILRLSSEENVSVGSITGPLYKVKGNCRRITLLQLHDCTTVEEVDIYNTEALQSCNGMFYNCQNLKKITPFKVPNVKDMSSMFYNCYSLTAIPDFPDSSNVTDMSGMMANCVKIEEAPQLDTSNVTNMTGMFDGCVKLKQIPLYNTIKVTNMSYMFHNCSSLLTIPQLNTFSVTDMSYMFSGCTSLTNIPELDTEFVTNMEEMFSGCENLESVPLLNTSNVTNMGSTFWKCKKLKSIPEFNTSSVTDMQGMFSTCSLLETIPLLDTSSCTNMNAMFMDCSVLTYVPNFDVSNVNNMSNMFNGCKNLDCEIEFTIPKATNIDYMFFECESLSNRPQLNAVSEECSAEYVFTYTKFMYDGCLYFIFNPTMGICNNMYLELTCPKDNPFDAYISVSNDNGENYEFIDDECISREDNYDNTCYIYKITVPFSSTNTHLLLVDFVSGLGEVSNLSDNCISIEGNANYLYRLQTYWNTEDGNTYNNIESILLANCDNIRTANRMFYNGQELKTILKSKKYEFNFSNTLVDTSYMFYGCSILETVPLFTTAQVTNMEGMFANCSSLKSVPDFDNENVVSMREMFKNCSSLEKKLVINNTNLELDTINMYEGTPFENE